MPLPVVRLQPHRQKRVALGHPWIYSNEIVMDDAAKAIEPGAMVSFYSADKSFLGVGSFNARTLIAGRIFSRNPTDIIDADWLKNRLRRALALRERLSPEPYYRLVHAEADGLPGLVVDRFGPYASLQFNTAGMQLLANDVEAALADVLDPQAIVLHNDSPVRALEGLARETRLLRGSIDGPVEVRENGLTYFADLVGGQKTGWYFDQRDNRALMARYAKGARLLDLYCHSGGFALLAAKAGAASVVGVDSSQPALDLAQRSAERNGISTATWHCANVFEDMEQRALAKEKYDIVIADPPPFVKSRKDIASGARGYRKLMRFAARLASSGGIVFIASCSHNMDLTRFTEEVANGLSDAHRGGSILHTVFAAPDHPTHPHLPESAYLKGLAVRVD